MKKYVEPSKEVLLQRFFAKVEKSPDPDGCWIWKGAADPHGYGLLRIGRRPNRKQVRAHVWHYEQILGPLDPGLVLHHRCFNKGCVILDHLDAITPSDHAAIHGHNQPLKLFCPRGHPYDHTNEGLCFRSNGKLQRYCKTCKAEYESTEEYKAIYRVIDANRRARSRSSPEYREKHRLYMQARRAKEKNMESH